MNNNEIGQLINYTNQLKEINIEEKVSNVFKGQNEVAQGVMAEDFFLDYKNMCDKVQILTKTSSIHRYLTANNIGGKNLLNNLNSLNSYLKKITNIEIATGDTRTGLAAVSNNNLSNFNAAFVQFKEIVLCLQSIDLWNGFNAYEKMKLSIEKREIKALKTSYLNIKKNSEILYKNQKHQTEEIKENYSEFLEKKSQMEDLIKNLTYNRQKIEDAKLEFAKVEGEISNQKNNISDSTKKIQEILKSGEDATNKTKKYISDSEKLFLNMEEKINTYEESNNKLSKLINGRETLEVLRGFDQRKKQLEKSLKFWGGLSIFGLLIWSFSTFIFFPTEALLEKTKILDVLIVLIPFSLKIMPQSVLVIFSLRQYSNERKTLEAYAFKAAQVLLLDNHADKFKENKSTKDIFLNNTLEKIHDEPFKKSSSVPEFTKKDIHKTLFRVEKIAKIFLGKKGLSLNINTDKKTI